MQLQDRNKIAYYSALSIFLGALELFIPKPLPFFKLGLANIPLLLSLSFPFKDFIVLALLKGIGNSYVSGNLFSIFGLISIAQSIVSALVMYVIGKCLKKAISRYGISMCGAFASTTLQLFLFSLYLGSSIVSLLPIMLLISLISSNIVAFISYRMDIDNDIPNIEITSNSTNSTIPIITLLLAGISIMALDSIPYAAIALIVSLSFQKISGRKIKALPYLIVSIILIISSLITPRGKVLYSLAFISITEQALEKGILNSLAICSCIALSQGYSQILKPSGGILGKTLGYFTLFISNFKRIEGESFIKRAKQALLIQENTNVEFNQISIKNYILIIYAIIFVALTLASRFIHHYKI